MLYFYYVIFFILCYIFFILILYMEKKDFIINYIIIYILVVLVSIEKISDINSDKYISSKIVENISILQFIHPNIITISGLLMNFYIYHLLNNPDSNIYILIICVIYRWLADCLDGEIARKYNKSTKIGHYLDTLSDIILGFICIHYVQTFIFNLSFNYSLLGYIVFLFILNNKYDFVKSHDKLKNKDKNTSIIDNFTIFNINNPIFMFLFIILVYYYK